MQALLRRGASILTPRTRSPTTDGKTTAASEDILFTKVNPAVDGEDCDHDCSTCTIRYPSKFDIDIEDKLYGHVKGWATHLLIATGKTDWVRDVADEEGSVMEAIEKGGLEPSNGVRDVFLFAYCAMKTGFCPVAEAGWLIVLTVL